MPRCEMCGEWPDCPWKTDPEILCGEFHPKPMTNAMKIRAMTDEELAEWLCDIAGWLPMYEGKMHPILDWLKEEAKE